MVVKAVFISFCFVVSNLIFFFFILFFGFLVRIGSMIVVSINVYKIMFVVKKRIKFCLGNGELLEIMYGMEKEFVSVIVFLMFEIEISRVECKLGL